MAKRPRHEPKPTWSANYWRRTLKAELWRATTCREIADLCVNCRMCASECPAHVNIPKLMLEAKAANTAEHGLDRADWTLARSESFAALASLFAVGVNAVLEEPHGSLVHGTNPGDIPKTPPAAFHEPELLASGRKPMAGPCRPRGRQPARGLLRRRVRQLQRSADCRSRGPCPAPPRRRSLRAAGAARLRHGAAGCAATSKTAQEAARHNVRILADLAREGYPIVCSEPTAALMLRNDYPYLVDDPDAQLVADRVVECTAYCGACMKRAGCAPISTRCRRPSAITFLVTSRLWAESGRAAFAWADTGIARAIQSMSAVRAWPARLVCGLPITTFLWRRAGRCSKS